MMATTYELHAIAGLPRSGSTLLCNIICQRPDAWATSTSCLPSFVRAVGAVASDQIEFKNLLNINQRGTEHRLAAATRAFCHQWHAVHDRPIVFDKSRAWNGNYRAFSNISPDGVILVCVRDLRDVFACVERMERPNGLLSQAPVFVRDRYAGAFAPDGVIGRPLRGVMNLVDERAANIYIVRYEDLVTDPAATMAGIYERCGMPAFDHSFDNVVDTAIDCDGFYLGKFPHKAGGKVSPRDPHYSLTIPDDIVADIMTVADTYNRVFGYDVISPGQNDAPATETDSEPYDVCNYV